MRFCSLGSGSGGNAHLVEKGETTLLFECGFAPSKLKKRLAARYVSPIEISAAFISHEHGDHIAGLKLLQEYNIPCYMSQGTARAMRYEGDWLRIYSGCAITVGELTITPVTVPHDVSEPLQFVVDDGARRMGLFTDLGMLTREVLRACDNLDGLFVECNYDDALLRDNKKYPEHVKERIRGEHGHLSNAAAGELVRQTKGDKRRQVIAGHVSKENNRPELARAALTPHDKDMTLRIATQDDGTEWINI